VEKGLVIGGAQGGRGGRVYGWVCDESAQGGRPSPKCMWCYKERSSPNRGKVSGRDFL